MYMRMSVSEVGELVFFDGIINVDNYLNLKNNGKINFNVWFSFSTSQRSSSYDIQNMKYKVQSTKYNQNITKV